MVNENNIFKNQSPWGSNRLPTSKRNEAIHVPCLWEIRQNDLIPGSHKKLETLNCVRHKVKFLTCLIFISS